jgi:hypothetical protein
MLYHLGVDHSEPVFPGTAQSGTPACSILTWVHLIRETSLRFPVSCPSPPLQRPWSLPVHSPSSQQQQELYHMCCCSLYSVLPCVPNPWSPSNANSNCTDGFSVVPGFEFRAFHLLDRCSTISVTSRPFFCCISQIGSHIFAQGQPQTVILLSVSYLTGITCVYHNA